MKKVLSIIIPTYNMEKYLNKCLDSLIVDNMEFLEVLIINDGSKDRSSEIAHEYEKKHPKTFKVIDKENGNYGSCINRGIKEATGKYVKVLDADDYFNKNNFYKYINEILTTDSDLIITPFTTIDISIPTVNTNEFLFKEYKENISLCDERKLPSEMHSFTYKLDILKRMKYVQTEGISYTDTEWCFYPLPYIKDVLLLNINVYQYILGREGQTMESETFKRRINQLQTIVIKMLEYLQNVKVEDGILRRMEKYLLVRLEMIYSIVLFDSNESNLKALKQIDKLIQSYSETFKEETAKFKLIKKIPFANVIKHWRKDDLIFHFYRLIKILSKRIQL